MCLVSSLRRELTRDEEALLRQIQRGRAAWTAEVLELIEGLRALGMVRRGRGRQLFKLAERGALWLNLNQQLGDMVPNHEGLASARTAAGYTQRQAALVLGVGQSTIAHWEAGSAVVSLLQLYRLALLYRVRPVELCIDPDAGEFIRKNNLENQEI